MFHVEQIIKITILTIQEKLKSEKTDYIICQDYTVSQETFNLKLNTTYDLLYTDNLPSDLSKYYESDAYISHTDSKKTIIDKLYQIVKNYTLKKKLRLINSFNTEQKNLLDIGSGTGDFLNTAKKNNWQVRGVEPSKAARDLAAEKGIQLEENIYNFSSEKFDVITLWHVLEHITDLDEYITQIKKLLSPKGILIIAVPNFKSYDAKHYKQFWAAYDVPRHVWHFSQKSISLIFKEFNFKLSKILPMKFDSFYVSILSEKYKTGNSNLIKAFFVGLRSNIKAKSKKEYSSLIYILKNS